MEDKYKVITTPLDVGHAIGQIQDTLNSYYEMGYEFVQMVPYHGYNCYYMIFKKKEEKDPYRQVTDISPAEMWPETHFKTEKDSNEATLRDILNSMSDEIKKNPIRIFSVHNKSVVGSIINGKECIPENVYDYKYLRGHIEPNTRIRGAQDIFVITVE